MADEWYWNLSSRRKIIQQAISRERDYQDEKWGDNPHSVGEWLLIVEAELSEAKRAWVKNEGNEDALKELLQAVAVGVACMEQHGIVERSHHPAYNNANPADLATLKTFTDDEIRREAFVRRYDIQAR